VGQLFAFNRSVNTLKPGLAPVVDKHISRINVLIMNFVDDKQHAL